mmetsp:Transcript_31679/g.31906  ORF Transcript_31679/g.31906 Transcript_31679/m.31906 type:complete len:95 (+) Transcript_31679:427-711(+)
MNSKFTRKERSFTWRRCQKGKKSAIEMLTRTRAMARLKVQDLKSKILQKIVTRSTGLPPLSNAFATAPFRPNQNSTVSGSELENSDLCLFYCNT